MAREPVGGLYDRIHIKGAIFVGGKEWEIAQLSEQSAQFGLENNEDRHGGKQEELLQQPAKDLQLKHRDHRGEANEHEEAEDNGPTARAL